MKQQYSRDDLISKLGQPIAPDKEMATIEVRGEGVRPAEGIELLNFGCCPKRRIESNEQGQAIAEKIHAAQQHHESPQDLLDQINDALGRSCQAVSLLENPESYVLLYACPRHRSLA